MVRSLLNLIAVMLLVLSGPAQGVLLAGAPPAASCCCCGVDAQDPSPCGMPKAPCAPRCPTSGASQGTQAPAVLASQVRTAQRRAPARKEPAPWPAAVVHAEPLAAFLTAAPIHGPPLRGREDPQAELRQFRI